MTCTLYEIVIRGVIGHTIEAALAGFEVVSQSEGDTTLRGWVEDQSALYGIISQIAGFGLEVTRLRQVDEATS